MKSALPDGVVTPQGIEPTLFARLAETAQARAEGHEPAHDFFHVTRVMRNASMLARAEGANEAVVVTAALLHELFTYPKNHPDSSKAGDVCAEHARELLEKEGAPAEFTSAVCAAIRDHAFSKGAVPEALEAKLLQDADRLDALGAIGLARMWATCADMKRPFYAPNDPFCTEREPDDKSWGLDHVFKKLLLLPSRLHTNAARAIAEERVAFIRRFLEQLKREI
ncbi:metal-dependent phosphohydrolase [Labilithrix luteola]|uniref:Metal-dependent phosphohydrolase n=1 Tax=Labilithrix luteola TaxID=1391654 RepID=A0A0K1PT92_9BACT|nr:HD domain-containing protein [Labilithrix luteola]AKU96349.1 metal-dependent phosphohydrolase [Labilithrix luteola]